MSIRIDESGRRWKSMNEVLQQVEEQPDGTWKWLLPKLWEMEVDENNEFLDPNMRLIQRAKEEDSQ